MSIKIVNSNQQSIYLNSIVLFELRQAGGLVPATGVSGTPEFCISGKQSGSEFWITDSTLLSDITEIGHGTYYSIFDFNALQSLGDPVLEQGDIIFTRFKSGGTEEARGESLLTVPFATPLESVSVYSFPDIFFDPFYAFWSSENLSATYADGTVGNNLIHKNYFADIHATIDSTNSQDEYTVIWYENGVPIGSGSNTISIKQRSDGTNIVTNAAMTVVSGTTGKAYRYNATGAQRISQGEAAIVTITGTVAGSSRSFSRVISRDKNS